MKILRVFPRRTNATPDDENVIINRLPNLLDFEKGYTEIHISVAFTYDIPTAEKLAEGWESVAPVQIGGPALGIPGGDFTPGMYLKNGYVITSRGCNNHCWFCSVPKREGKVRELPITEGWNVLDDNLLACSGDHIDKVFEMLKTQPEKPMFTGGLEARLISPAIASKLRELRPKVLYFAYDTADDLEPLFEAGKMLYNAGFPRASHILRCYCLCGFPKDTFEKAESRFLQAWDAGFLPMAMLYRDKSGYRDPEWIKWSWQWVRSMTAACNCKRRSSRTKISMQ